jgi:hypothetical protein
LGQTHADFEEKSPGGVGSPNSALL